MNIPLVYDSLYLTKKCFFNSKETSAIILSKFPKHPAELGHIFEIPQAHCNIKEGKLDNGGGTVGYRKNGTY